ncbi:MAG: hypothetical protein WCP97_02375 [bacterium]
MNKHHFNTITQIALPTLTLTAQLAIALKQPFLGLIINMFAQPFWLYSSWKSYKKAGQSGIFITTVFFSAITAFGIINYLVTT